MQVRDYISAKDMTIDIHCPDPVSQGVVSELVPAMAPMILESKHLGYSCVLNSIDMLLGSKRKATDPPDDLGTSKRIKNSHTASPEAENKPIKVIPFPEKVGPTYILNQIIQDYS